MQAPTIHWLVRGYGLLILHHAVIYTEYCVSHLLIVVFYYPYTSYYFSHIIVILILRSCLGLRVESKKKAEEEPRDDYSSRALNTPAYLLLILYIYLSGEIEVNCTPSDVRSRYHITTRDRTIKYRPAV